MLNGLDVCSGIGGLSLALKEWVRPIAYCEINRYCISVLLSRMEQEQIPRAPIYDDIKTLGARNFSSKRLFDIIYGGFPCQDISVAGNGKGLEGERSGLFFEIIQLVKELGPRFVFLENVPAITTRGGTQVINEFTSIGYDCRWTMVSAAELGAPHLRRRWFVLAWNANGGGERKIGEISERTDTEPRRVCGDVSYPNSKRGGPPKKPGSRSPDPAKPWNDGKEKSLADSENSICKRIGSIENRKQNGFTDQSWWKIEPNVDRVVDELPFRVDRLKALGNSVVPIQAREAFKRLMGLE